MLFYSSPEWTKQTLVRDMAIHILSLHVSHCSSPTRMTYGRSDSSAVSLPDATKSYILDV